MTNALRAALQQLSEAKRQLDMLEFFEAHPKTFGVIPDMRLAAVEKLRRAAHAVSAACGGQDETEERPNG